MANPRKLLVIDTSYSYEAIEKRELKSSVICRDLDGYFEHVWSVHPFATLVTSKEHSPEYGRPIVYSINKKHTFVEGKIGISPIIKKIPIINFLLSQIDVFLFLICLIRREKISVIRVGDPLYLGIFGYCLSKLTKTPFVVRIGSNNRKIRETTGRCIMPRLFMSIRQEEFLEQFVLTHADLVAGANRDNLKFAINSGANPDRCTLFRYGNLIDAAHFSAPITRPSPEPRYSCSSFLLCIARLESVKKVDDVIRVLADIRKSDFYLQALLIGDGSERNSLEQLAIKLGVQDQVVFCGNRDQNWLSTIIPHAQMVLSPHTGRALTEAALGAAPIVAYDIDWQSELIESGVTGELVEFGDWEALSDATVKFLKDRSYARKMGDQVRLRALEMMDPVKLNQHEINQYEKLIRVRSYKRQVI